MFKALIIDDEVSSIETLTNHIKKSFSNEISIINTTTDYHEGLMLIKVHSPDIVFLDIDLSREHTGFDFLAEARNFNTEFKVIFVTAYNQFGIRAVKEQAFDYLLKPIDVDDLALVVNKLQSSTKEKANFKDFIIINNKETIHKVFINDILYIQGDGGYSELFLDSKERPILISNNLSKIEEEIGTISNHFFRIHKSYVVNLQKVTKINKHLTSKNVELTNSLKLPVSRSKYADFVNSFLSQ